MKLEDFVSPIRPLDRGTTDLLLKDVLAHLLYLINELEAEELNKGKWSISEIYNTAACDLLALYTDCSSPADIRELKRGLVA